MNWLKRLRCQHPNVEVRTYLENDHSGPCVRRTMKCVDCGSVDLLVPQLAPERTLALLAQAEKLPQGSVVEI